MSAFDKPVLQTSDPKKVGQTAVITRTIYYAEVISIDDATMGGRIKVKIYEFDNRTTNTDELPWCYPLLPKYFFNLPKVGEMVRIFIEDTKYPQRSRFWLGSVISQPHKIGLDTRFTALSTTNVPLTNPEPAPNTYPDAVGVYPLSEDIAIVGRVNTDVILRVNEIHIRAGKHENGNVLKLNTKNPAEISMVFEPVNLVQASANYQSRTVVTADKIAIISHSGNPQFKATNFTSEDRDRIFAEGHPMVRGDVLVQAMDIMRKVIINHIHGYNGLAADKNLLIKDLEAIDFSKILQNNLVIN